MRNGIGALLFVLGFAAPLGCISGCISGDVDEEPKTRTVPEGTDPESASFQIVRRNDGTHQALVIRLSTISMCERTAVPVDHAFVELELVIAVDAQFTPETCKLDQSQRCRIRLLRTTAPECANTGGPIAGFGRLTIDEVTDEIVRGSYEGWNRDSKIDLRGTFVARPCTGSAACP